MPRSVVRRSWTFILLLGVLLAACLVHPSRSYSDMYPEENPPIGGGGGTGVGDPDVPVNTIKKQQRGVRGSRNASLTVRREGERREVGEGSIWMWRLSVVTQVIRIYWSR
jgi:hypothetical protein